mmetsp:Transcript_27852/g.33863  ORF Transcript_27852/g.33863 Transcript_27852/m.33863 type:complete len:119 (-) Transcript_27852:127-483(-)
MDKAAKLSNPVWLTEEIKDDSDIINILYPLADLLKIFRYSQIIDNIIKELKRKMHGGFKEAWNYHKSLGDIEPSRLYQTWMQKRIRRSKLPNGTALDWNDNSREYATQIWKWWKVRRN